MGWGAARSLGGGNQALHLARDGRQRVRLERLTQPERRRHPSPGIPPPANALARRLAQEFVPDRNPGLETLSALLGALNVNLHFEPGWPKRRRRARS